MVSVLRSRASLHLEVLALRHQLAVLQRAGRRPRLKPADRVLWAWLSKTWSGWQDALVLVKPEPRAVQPPEAGQVVEIREAGGLYRHYERAAA